MALATFATESFEKIRWQTWRAPGGLYPRSVRCGVTVLVCFRATRSFYSNQAVANERPELRVARERPRVRRNFSYFALVFCCDFSPLELATSAGRQPCGAEIKVASNNPRLRRCEIHLVKYRSYSAAVGRPPALLRILWSAGWGFRMQFVLKTFNF